MRIRKAEGGRANPTTSWRIRKQIPGSLKVSCNRGPSITRRNANRDPRPRYLTVMVSAAVAVVADRSNPRLGSPVISNEIT